MAHIILPILIDGTKYCVDQQGNRRTQALFSSVSSQISENEFKLLEFTSNGVVGIVAVLKFGVGCGTNLRIDFDATFDVPPDWADWAIGVDGGNPLFPDEQAAAGELPGDDSAVLELEPRPCGNIVTVRLDVQADTSRDGDTYRVDMTITTLN